MDGSVIDLSKYRFERALEDLKTAEDNLNAGSYRASANRSYYAVFHALRAVTALDQFDSGKHSGIIAYINLHYVKAGIFEKSFSKMIDSTMRLREKADYEDFNPVTQEEAEIQIERAKEVVSIVEKYVHKQWNDDKIF